MFGFIFITVFSIFFFHALYSNLKHPRFGKTEKIIVFSVWGIFTAILLFGQYMSVIENRARKVACHALFQTSKTASDTLHNLLENKNCWAVLTNDR